MASAASSSLGSWVSTAIEVAGSIPPSCGERLLRPRGDHLLGVRKALRRGEPPARIDHVAAPAGGLAQPAQRSGDRHGAEQDQARRRRHHVDEHRAAQLGGLGPQQLLGRPAGPRRRARASPAIRTRCRPPRTAAWLPGRRPPAASPRPRGRRRARCRRSGPGWYSCTQTSISPPHGRPTFQASSSAIPKCTSCGGSPSQHPVGELDHRALDAAAGHGADDLPVLVDGHLGAGGSRRRLLDGDHGRRSRTGRRARSRC